MPVPSAVISVTICCEEISLSKRAFSTLSTCRFSGRMAWNLRSRPCLAEPPAESPSTMINFAQRRILFLAVGQFSRQAHAVEHAFAPRHFACLARRFARARGFDDLAGNDFGVEPVFPAEIRPAFAQPLPPPPGVTSDETSFILVCEANFGSGIFTESTQARPSRMSSPVISTLAFLAISFSSMYLLMTARHRRAQAGEVRAAVATAECCW